MTSSIAAAVKALSQRVYIKNRDIEINAVYEPAEVKEPELRTGAGAISSEVSVFYCLPDAVLSEKDIVLANGETFYIYKVTVFYLKGEAVYVKGFGTRRFKEEESG